MGNGHVKDVLHEGQYRRQGKRGVPQTPKAAVLIDGKGAGSIFYICLAEKCDVHEPRDPLPADDVEQKAQRKKEALADAGRETVASPHPRSHPQEAPDVLARPTRW